MAEVHRDQCRLLPRAGGLSDDSSGGLSLALRRAGGRLHSRRRRSRPDPKPAAVRPRLVARRLSRAGRRAVAAASSERDNSPYARAPPVGDARQRSSCSGTSAPCWCPSASSPAPRESSRSGASSSWPRSRCSRPPPACHDSDALTSTAALALRLSGGRDLPCRKRHRRHRLGGSAPVAAGVTTHSEVRTRAPWTQT